MLGSIADVGVNGWFHPDVVTGYMLDMALVGGKDKGARCVPTPAFVVAIRGIGNCGTRCPEN